MNIQKQIDQITQEIKLAEKSYPPRDATAHRWADINRPYELHCVKIRDLYWKRRMLIAKRDDLDTQETAKVY
jgi:hypothetical protein